MPAKNAYQVQVLDGMAPIIYLSIGARVRLTVNKWAECGLCNGALGYVRDVVYNEQGAPLFVMVEFDDLAFTAEESFFGDEERKNWVPSSEF